MFYLEPSAEILISQLCDQTKIEESFLARENLVLGT